MFIAQNHSECNNARNEINKITLTGNIVPGIWYHKLLRSCGKSDTTTIAILSVLVFLHRYNGDTEFQLNFNYFKNKSNFSKWCHQVNNTARPRLYLITLNNLIIHYVRFDYINVIKQYIALYSTTHLAPII
ncbi:hypothetical protein [Candidatus Tisiphia endosymbiont of Micropterix aruncella]|uniref:hypothetical protein n=1 Tax=Candidatus Tisiphia endosymbiont of Micropterix aruncella TaxID=3066271 RepID=UPI003AA8B62A